MRHHLFFLSGCSRPISSRAGGQAQYSVPHGLGVLLYFLLVHVNMDGGGGGVGYKANGQQLWLGQSHGGGRPLSSTCCPGFAMYYCC